MHTPTTSPAPFQDIRVMVDFVTPAGGLQSRTVDVWSPTVLGAFSRARAVIAHDCEAWGMRPSFLAQRVVRVGGAS